MTKLFMISVCIPGNAENDKSDRIVPLGVVSTIEKLIEITKSKRTWKELNNYKDTSFMLPRIADSFYMIEPIVCDVIEDNVEGDQLNAKIQPK